jgi:hypothetical protein
MLLPISEQQFWRRKIRCIADFLRTLYWPAPGLRRRFLPLSFCFFLFAPVVRGESVGESLADPAIVFPPGESLTYEVKWDPPVWMFFLPTMSAGQMTLQCQKHFQFQDQSAFLFSANAFSSGFLPKLTGLTVNDYFESIVEAKNFCSMRMYKKTQEGKRLFEMTQTFNPGQTTGYLLIKDDSKSPPRTTRDEEVNDLPPCVQDLVSIVYHARLHPLRVGEKYPMVICESGKARKFNIFVRRKEMVNTSVGQVSALLIEGETLPGVLFKEGGRFSVWATDDERKIPLRYEINVKLGRVFGDLLKYPPPTEPVKKSQ